MNTRDTSTPPPKGTSAHHRCVEHRALSERISHCRQEIVEEKMERIKQMTGVETDLKSIKDDVHAINLKLAKYMGALTIILIAVQGVMAWLVRTIT